MKKTFYYLLPLLLVAGLTGCKDAPKEKEKFIMKPGTYLYLNVYKDLKAEEGNGIMLSPRNIVKYSSGMTYTDIEGYEADLGFGDYNRDFENNRFKMTPDMVIEPVPHMINGKRTDVWSLKEGFIRARNVRIIFANLAPIVTDDGVLIPAENGVVAYIPNKTMERAEKAIREAWAKGDTEEVYRLFNDAYTFIPIAPADYEALKEKGEL